MTLTWHIAQVSQAGRRAAVSLREHRFTVYCPMERVWKAIPKGSREEVERPLLPGYIFVGVAPWNDVAVLQETDGRARIDGLTRIMPTKLSAERLAALVYDMSLRQCAGEFDKTGSHRYLPPKPLVGPLTRSVGRGLTALESLLRTEPSGRIDLILSGEILDQDEEFAEAA